MRTWESRPQRTDSVEIARDKQNGNWTGVGVTVKQNDCHAYLFLLLAFNWCTNEIFIYHVDGWMNK